MMTNVMPSAMMPIVALFLSMFSQLRVHRLSQPRKLPWSNPRAMVCSTIITTSAHRVENSGRCDPTGLADAIDSSLSVIVPQLL